MAKLLVVDDDVEICDFLRNYFSKKRYKVLVATGGEEALGIIRSERPHIVLLDIKMPGVSGIEVLRQSKEFDPKIKVIMITAIGDKDTAELAKKFGADDYVTKPFSLEYLEKDVMWKIEELLLTKKAERRQKRGYFFGREMAKNILIKIGDLEIKAELNDSKTARMVYDKLPIKSRLNLWGDEIYFDIPVKADLEEGFSRDVVEVGDLGYWPEGTSFCIFFGPTPVSKPGEIRPASSVNLIGRLTEDARDRLKKARSGERVILEKVKTPTEE